MCLVRCVTYVPGLYPGASPAPSPLATSERLRTARKPARHTLHAGPCTRTDCVLQPGLQRGGHLVVLCVDFLGQLRQLGSCQVFAHGFLLCHKNPNPKGSQPPLRAVPHKPQGLTVGARVSRNLLQPLTRLQRADIEPMTRHPEGQGGGPALYPGNDLRSVATPEQIRQGGGSRSASEKTRTKGAFATQASAYSTNPEWF